MKTVIKFYYTLLLLPVTIAFFSCANVDFVKRKYMPGYYVDKSTKNKLVEVEATNGPVFIGPTTMEETVKINHQELTQAPLTTPILINGTEFLRTPSKYLEECDEIILKNGDIIKAKVTDIGVTEIKYKKCDNLNGPTVSILKSDVFMIKYTNGTKDVFNSNEKPSNSTTKNIDKSNAHNDGFSFASFVLGIFGLFLGLFISGIVGVVFGILGIIFGAVSIGRIGRNPEKYNGKGLAIVGLITGIIITVLFAFLMILLAGLI